MVSRYLFLHLISYESELILRKHILSILEELLSLIFINDLLCHALVVQLNQMLMLRFYLHFDCLSQKKQPSAISPPSSPPTTTLSTTIAKESSFLKSRRDCFLESGLCISAFPSTPLRAGRGMTPLENPILTGERLLT